MTHGWSCGGKSSVGGRSPWSSRIRRCKYRQWIKCPFAYYCMAGRRKTCAILIEREHKQVCGVFSQILVAVKLGWGNFSDRLSARPGKEIQKIKTWQFPFLVLPRAACSSSLPQTDSRKCLESTTTVLLLAATLSTIWSKISSPAFQSRLWIRHLKIGGIIKRGSQNLRLKQPR